MFLSLGLVKKHNNGFRRIHYLSYPYERSVNASILKKYSDIKYITFNDIIRMIKITERHTIIFKKILKISFEISLLRLIINGF